MNENDSGVNCNKLRYMTDRQKIIHIAYATVSSSSIVCFCASIVKTMLIILFGCCACMNVYKKVRDQCDLFLKHIPKQMHD